jgi:hypothetical protein
MGFCGLDRRHAPLQGDEVRACWQDGAVPAPPDPVTPGLLDLLTVARIGERIDGDPVPPGASPSQASSDAGPSARGSRPAAIATASGSRRLWVEVEV